MSWQYYNPNPNGKFVGDCVYRALSKALGFTWERTYAELATQGFMMGDAPISNEVWGAYLLNRGFTRHIIPNTCPDCYTVSDFCHDNPYGTYVLATGNHVVTVVDGDFFDFWDSGHEVPIYFFERNI